MRHTHASPAAGDGQKNLRRLADEVCLLLWREHQVSIALRLRRERGENPAAHAEVSRAHVRALFGALKAQSDAAKVCSCHRCELSFGPRPSLRIVGESFYCKRDASPQFWCGADIPVRVFLCGAGALARELLMPAQTPSSGAVERSPTPGPVSVFSGLLNPKRVGMAIPGRLRRDLVLLILVRGRIKLYFTQEHLYPTFAQKARKHGHTAIFVEG